MTDKDSTTYRFRPRCILREMGSRHVLMVIPPIGQEGFALQVNDSFAFLFRQVYGTSFTLEDLTKALSENYSLPRDVAMAEATVTLNLWKKQGLIA